MNVDTDLKSVSRNNITESPFQDFLQRVRHEYGFVPFKLNFWTWRYLQKYRPELFGRPIRRHKNNGYVLIKRADHPQANKRGYLKESRYVWELHNKACLLPWADVHHISGVKDDNRIENLEVMMHRDHIRLECIKNKPWRGRIKQRRQQLEAHIEK